MYGFADEGCQQCSVLAIVDLPSDGRQEYRYYYDLRSRVLINVFQMRW